MIAAAEEADIPVIGMMVDQEEEAPEHVVTSLIWNVRPTVDAVIAQIEDGPEAVDLGKYSFMKAGGSSIADINVDVVGGVPEDLVAKVEEKEAAIQDGGFETPSTRALPPSPSPSRASDVPSDERRAGAGPLLELSGVTKRYGDLVANDDVSLTVAPGEVVAMLGENGAGKSTLMKIVYGLVRPDAGTVTMDGRRLEIGSPRDAMAAGIGMVTQEFSLVDTMTVAENVALSGLGLGRVDRAAVRRVIEAMERIGVRLDPDQLVSTLSIGERQRVEIVKALFHDCRVVILDEPTAVLAAGRARPVRHGSPAHQRRSRRPAGLAQAAEVAEISDRVVVCGADAWSAPA